MQVGALPHDPALTFEGIEVTFASAQEGGTAPAPQTYDLVLPAVGRTPNGKKIAADKADKAGIAVTDRGLPHCGGAVACCCF
jgi:pyruvate/2-oxoglutarate dehydrogenase complex dihydrolipoamide dehydrogenase (E3) component